jgi:hypothetical protein
MENQNQQKLRRTSSKFAANNIAGKFRLARDIYSYLGEKVGSKLSQSLISEESSSVFLIRETKSFS